MADLLDLADERYVLLTTFRKNGTPVGTAVWAARDGDTLVVTTGANSGKVKRLRHTSRVELRACNVRGRPFDAARACSGEAVVVRDPVEMEVANRCIAAKYGWQFRVMTLFDRVVSRIRTNDDGVIVRIRDLDDTTDA